MQHCMEYRWFKWLVAIKILTESASIKMTILKSDLNFSWMKWGRINVLKSELEDIQTRSE